MKAKKVQQLASAAQKAIKAKQRKENAERRKSHSAALNAARKPYMGSILRQLVDAASQGKSSTVVKLGKHVDDSAFSRDAKAIEVLEVEANSIARKLKRDGYSVTLKREYYSGDSDGIPTNCTTWYELTVSWGKSK